MRILASLTVLTLAGAASAAPIVVSPSNLQGWQIQVTAAGGSVTFVSGPAMPPAGTGSARLFTGTQGDQAAQLRQPDYADTRLDSLTELGYHTYGVQWNGTPSGGGQLPYLILNLDLDGNGSIDDLIFFEPEYQNGYTTSVPTQADAQLGVWQSWDALAGGWWSLNGIGGLGPGANVNTIAVYLAAAPDATIVNSGSGLGGVRVLHGFASPSDVFEGHVDDLAIGVGGMTTEYDFEPERSVRVDLRPRNTGNQINTSSRQLVPIAILSEPDFDATSEVDPDSAAVRGATPVVTRTQFEDVDDDGLDDIVVYFRAREIAPPTPAECADPDARIVVTASTFDAMPLVGSDRVAWLGPACD